MDTSLSEEEPTFPGLSDFFIYFDFLGDMNEIYTYSLMDLESKSVIPGYGVKHGKVEEIDFMRESLVTPDLNSVPSTVHVVLNQTDLNGRKTANIVAPRVFCLDIDSVISKESIREIIDTSQAQLVVESSPGKYHLYWKAHPTVSLSDWSTIQAGLAALYGGDPALSAVGHMIRVPGISRICKDGTEFLPRIAFDSGDRTCIDGMTAQKMWPSVIELGQKAQKKARKERSKLRDSVRGASSTDDLVLVGNRTESGKRNETLFSAVREFVRKGGMNGNGPHRTIEEAEEAGRAVNSGFGEGLSEDEIIKTVESAYKSAEESLIRAQEKHDAELEVHGAMTESDGTEVSHGGTVGTEGDGLGGGGDGGSSTCFPYNYDDRFLRINRFTEKALAARVLQRFKGHMVRTGEFVYAFDIQGKVWRRQKSGDAAIIQEYVEECAVDTIRDPLFGAVMCSGKDGESSTKRMTAESAWLSHNRINRSTSTLLSLTRLPEKEITSFDAEPHTLFCRNGVVNMITGEVHEPKREDYLLQRCSVEFDESAKCPYWLNFLNELFQFCTNPDVMVSFMQELFGYSLTGEIGEQKIFVHTGGGSNGKSKVLQVLRAVSGGYSALLGCTVLAKSKGALQKEFDRIGPKIEGKRVVVVDDLDTQTQWNEGFIKSLTGKTIPSRHLYAEERDIPNKAKIHIGCNTVPTPETENYGMLRRICIIPYLRRFTPDPGKDREIEARTTEELSGILNWATEGLQRMVYEKRGIFYPSEIKDSMDEYKQDYFKIENAVDMLFEPADQSMSIEKAPPIKVLTDYINEFLGEIGSNEVVDSKVLGRLLQSKGYMVKQSDSKTLGRVYRYWIKYKNLE